MQRQCFSFQIRTGTLQEYQKRHDEIWPELVSELKSAGLSNYSLFRYDDEHIIGYVECEPDAITCFGTLARAEANSRWSEWFEDIIVSLGDDDGNMRSMKELWHLS